MPATGLLAAQFLAIPALAAEVTAAMAEDPAFVAVRAFSAAQDAQLGVLRERGDAIQER